jgi:transcriptional regulator with XRE-family HTH domain
MDSLEGFARRLQEAMARQRVKNPAVARAVGVHPTTVSKWRTGTQPIEEMRVPRLAEFLDVSEAWLVDGTHPRERIARRDPPVERDSPAIDGGVSFSRQIREREKEVELELVRMGANDVEVRGFAQSIRGNPLLVAAFSGGAPATQLTNSQIMELFDAAASGYTRIVAMLIAEREKEARRR